MAILMYIMASLISTVFILGLRTLSSELPQTMVPIQQSSEFIFDKPVSQLRKEQSVTHLNRLNNDVNRPSYCHPIPSKRSSANKDPYLDCSLPYVSINGGGRLGNQICQYSVLVILREIFGIRVAVEKNTTNMLSNIFDHLQVPTVSKECFSTGSVKHVKFGDLYKDLLSNLKKADALANNSSTAMKILGGSYHIEHNPCPSEIFWLYRDELRKEFVFKSSIINKAKAKINDILQVMGTSRENVTIVTVHVRRTDYKKWMKKYYDAEPISELYFKRAFNFYRERWENPLFLVTSDDPKWCRQHLKEHDVKIASSSDAAVDFAILSLGDHHIRSSGTFGFNSAMLGQGGMAYPVNYSKKFAWQTEILGCVRGLDTLFPINAGK